MCQLLLRPRISYWEDAGKIRIVNRGLLTHQIALVWTSFMAQKSCLHWETYINLSAGLSVCPKHQDIVQFTFECCSKQDTRHLQHQPVKVACSMWRLGAGNACWMLDFWCLSTLMEASSFGMVKTKECNCNSPDIYWINRCPGVCPSRVWHFHDFSRSANFPQLSSDVLFCALDQWFLAIENELSSPSPAHP